MSSITLSLKDVVLAFPDVFEPRSVNGGDPRFSGSFILPKDHPDLQKIEDAIEQVAVAKWGKKAKSELEQLQKKDKTCLHDGDDKADYAGFKDNLFVSASRKPEDGAPVVIDRDKSDLKPQDGKIYPGVRVVARLGIWAQENQYGKRINAELRGVQFYAHGESLGGAAPASEDEFDDLSDMGDDFDDMEGDADDLV